MLTLNLWGRSGDWPSRRRALREGLQRLRPDVALFQEAMCTTDYDQAADLLGTEFHFAHQRARQEGSGISIASRWPIDRVRELDLHLTPRTGEFPCAALIAEVTVPQIGPVIVVNHFPNWDLTHEYERERQAVIVARHLEELAPGRDRHVVIGGDLDAAPDATSIRFWSGRQSLDGVSVCYRDAWESAHPGEPGHTFTPRNPLVIDRDWPFRRIDYIFVRCDVHGGPTLRIASCALAFDEPIDGVWASDHFGVIADLEPPAR